MADPGRLRELLVPGAELRVRPAHRPGRTTRWSAVLVRAPDGRGWVSVDTTLPNRLVGGALERRAVDEFEGFDLEKAEWTHGRSRFDFLLRARPDRVAADDDFAPGVERVALEVKSVTLVEDGVALFPDAVTARGARHLDELASLARTPGWGAAVLFVLQRAGARRIRACASIDPHFADRLAAARSEGVRVFGRRCRVDERRVRLGPPIPVQ